MRRRSLVDRLGGDVPAHLQRFDPAEWSTDTLSAAHHYEQALSAWLDARDHWVATGGSQELLDQLTEPLPDQPWWGGRCCL